MRRPRVFALARFWDFLTDTWPTRLARLGVRLKRPAAAGRPVPLGCERMEERVVPDGRPLPVPLIFAGVGEGQPPRVRAYFAETGKLAFERTPFAAGFAGGVRVAAGDVNRDGYPDLIAAAGPGGGPHVKVLDGKTGDPIAGPLGSFLAYSKGFQGGVYVAAGDVDGDQWADVITAAGKGGGPHVKVFSGRTGEEIASFYAFDPQFQGGATVMAADFTGDGKADLAVGAGEGGGPHVKVFDLTTKQVIPGPLGSFRAFDSGFAGGVSVGTDMLAGDVTGDGVPDLAVGMGTGGSQVKVFDGKTGAVVRTFQAFTGPLAAAAGVRVALAYVSDDPYADVIVGTGAGPTARIKVFDGKTGAELADPMSPYVPFGASFTGGLYVAASNDPYIYSSSVTASPNPVAPGQPFTVTASLAVSPGSPSPTGTVTVKVTPPSGPPVLTLGSGTLVPIGGGGGAQATLTNVVLTTPGNYTNAYLVYGGDANYAPYTGNGYSQPIQVIGPPPPPPPPTTGSLAGFVYHDANNDGAKQSEAGIAGVTVQLTGPVTRTTTTGSDGAYQFTALPAGTYTLTETQPAGYFDGKDTAGTLGGNATAVNDKISGIPVTAGSAGTGYLFGELVPAGLSGFVYRDAQSGTLAYDNDGVKQAGEAGLAGVTVTLSGTNDLGQAVGVTVATGSDGSYQFANLRPGGYTLTEAQPGGYLDGKETAGTLGGNATSVNDQISAIPVTSGAAGSNYLFGELPAGWTPPARLSGYAYRDNNNNGLKEGGEFGVGGVGVTLQYVQSGVITQEYTSATGADGKYEFVVAPGSYYQVVASTPPGYFEGKATPGSPGGGTVYGHTIVGVSLASGMSSEGNNFGRLVPGQIGGGVYFDHGSGTNAFNNNGVWNAGEKALAGVAVSLSGVNDLGVTVTASTTTGTDGKYQFTGLRAGTYSVSETQPVAYQDGKETAGSLGGNAMAVNDSIITIPLNWANDGTGYNFGELPPPISIVLFPYDNQCGCGLVYGQPPGVAQGRAGKTPSGVRSDGATTVNLLSGLAIGGLLGGIPVQVTFGNAAGYADGSGGASGMASSAIRLVGLAGGVVAMIDSAGSALFFLPNGAGGFVAAFNYPAALTGGGSEYVLTDAGGVSRTFYGFGGGVPAGREGRLKSYTDAGGVVTQVTAWDAAGRPLEYRTTDPVSGAGRSVLFAYSGTGQVTAITLRVNAAGGSDQTVRAVTLAYAAVAGAALPVMVQATETDGTGAVLAVTYNRYYAAGEANGYPGGLKYALGPAAAARLQAAYPGQALDTLSDAQVAVYADKALEFDPATRQVTRAVTAAAGCSVCSGGQGAGVISYAVNPTPTGDVNGWATRVTEGMDDGSSQSVYVNGGGQVLMTVVTAADGNRWATYYRYDAAGRLVLVAAPSAMTAWGEGYGDLVGWSGGSAAGVSDWAGVITDITYGASTTATDSAPGDVLGWVKGVSVRNGLSGTSVPQSAASYLARTAVGFVSYHAAADTVYRNANGTGAQTTSYAYTWFASTHRPQQVTVTLPAVSAAQNGSGVAAAQTVVFDAAGRPTWVRDAGGFLGHTQYDPLTGAVTKTIGDVNVAQSGSYTNLPAGWTTPAGGGAHAVTSYEVDVLGRPTRVTQPDGGVTYVVYTDAAHEVRVYAGWTGSAGTGPTTVYREDWARGYTETLTMSATPAVAGGRPTGAEAIAGVQSLQRQRVNAVGQVVAVDAYTSLAGIGYSTDPVLGTHGVNYLETQYAYDKRGWNNRVVSPIGAIYRQVYDALGRPVSTWAGGNDTPASGFWSPSNPAEMNLMSATEYDNNQVGDSTVTAYTVYPGVSGRAPRRTEAAYDWRGRLVAVRQAGDPVAGTLQYFTYDNLGEVLTAAVYQAGYTTVSTSEPSVGTRRAYTVYAYDDRGQVYQTDSYGVNQSSGALAADPLTSRVWYDQRGLAAKAESPDGPGQSGFGLVPITVGGSQPVQVVKATYDGLGRAVKTFLSDGGGDASWADAFDVLGDIVWSQAEAVYDADSNLLQTTTRTRFDSQSGTGVLGTPTAGTKARVSYAGYYYDAADRLTAAVDVGTNGNAAWTRPTSVPARSDAVLVTSVAYGANGLPQDVTDARGVTSRTVTDLLGRTVSQTAAFGTTDALTVSYAYDSGGRLASVTRPGNRTTLYGYDGADRLRTITDPLGRVTMIARDRLDGLLDTTDAAGVMTSYTEDALGRVVGVTEAAGTSLARTSGVSYDLFGRVLSSTDPRGNTTTTSYDDVARRVWTTDALGNTAGTAFDLAGRAIGVLDPYGESVNWTYDKLGRLASVTDPLLNTRSFRYLVNGSEDQAADPLGNTSRQTYDPFGRVGSVVDPLGNTTAVAYDRNSNVVGVTNAKGVTTAFAYDNLDRQTSVTEAVGKAEQRTTSYAFNGSGDLVTVTDPLNRQTTFGYDAAGRMVSQTAAANTAEAFTVTTGYDNLDRVVSVTRPGGRTTGYAFDALSQMTKVTEGVGTGLERFTTVAYDQAGNTVSVTNPLGNTTGYAYDKLNRVTTTTDALGGVVTVGYDKAGRTASLTDQVGNTTTWAYDTAGRPLGETDPLGKTTGYGYDAAGRLVSVTDRLGRVRQFGYDAAGRVTSETWKTSGGATVQTQTFGYDAVGNLTSATDPDGSYALTYDNLNRAVSVAGPFGVTQTFGYDAADNRVSVADSLGGGVTSTFDHLDRLTSRTQTVGGANTVKAAWTYDAKGDRTQAGRASWNGTSWASAGTTDYAFDDLGRTTGITHKNAAGVTVGGAAYTFDAGDRVTAQTINGATQTFGYDKLGQLVNDNGTVYAYDAAGNRTGAGIVVGAGNRITSDGTWAYTYDAAGQLVGKSKAGEAWAYTYDHRGQMTGASRSATVGGTVTDSVSYQTDAWGNRIGRTQAGTVERYVVDGWDPAKPGAIGTENFDSVIDLDGSNAVTSRRVFGAGFDEPVVRREAGGDWWYGADGLGSVRQVFDNVGNVVGSRAYTGFGEATGGSGGGFDRYQWTGAGTDPLTGQVGENARVYDPDKKGWTSEDPIRFGGGDANLSRAVGNSPTNRTDPSGLEDELTFISILGKRMVKDRRGNFIGELVDIGGVSHVLRKGKVAELEVIEQAQKPGWGSAVGWWTESDRREQKKWDNWFADNSNEFKPQGYEAKTSVSGGGPENEYLNKLSERGACNVSQMGTIHGQTYLAAGKEASSLIKDMIQQVGADLLDKTVGSWGQAKVLQFLGHLGSKGWTVLRNKGGKVLGILDESGKKINKDALTNAANEFADAMTKPRRVSGARETYLGSKAVGLKEIKLVRSECKELGASVMENADTAINQINQNAVALFVHTDKTILSASGSVVQNIKAGTLLMRSNATPYTIFHEMTHAKQWKDLGPKAYKDLGQYRREKHVFDTFMGQSSKFSNEEREDAIRYMREIQALFDAGLID